MSLIEEIMNELEKERNKKTLNDVFHVTLSEETWVVTPKAGACPECKSFSQKKYHEKPEPTHPNCKCKITYEGHYYVVGIRKLDKVPYNLINKEPQGSIYKKEGVSTYDPYDTYYRLGFNDSNFKYFIQHQHFIRDDGKNFGFFQDGVHSEDNRINEYIKMNRKLKAKYIELAKEKVKNNFTKDTYTLYNNNCQNFVNTVISVAKSIAESNKESLYLEN